MSRKVAFLVRTRRKRLSNQVSSELQAAIRDIARKEGYRFQAVLDDAMQEYIDNHDQEKLRGSVMAHFQASVDRNRRLGKLLANDP